MLGHVGVQDPPSSLVEHEEAIHELEGGGNVQ
jgi:hypothetical protein